MFPLILGSASPRRKEILSYFSLPLSIVPSSYEESHPKTVDDPTNYVCNIAREKALALKDQFPNNPVLTADTIVVMGNELFVKPDSDQDAYEMLSKLSGNWHHVFTAVCVLYKDKLFVKAESTAVLFHDLDEKQKKTYHDVFFFQDKAAGYAIQKAGSIVVKKIEGCYYNIMGLPINTTRELLENIGISLWDYLKGD